MNTDALTVLTGSAHPALARAIEEHLGCRAVPHKVERFPDGEIHVEIDGSVRGRDVVIVQPTLQPVGEHILELLLLADASRRGGARTVTAVVPYYGLARQDRRAREGESLGVRVVSDVLSSACSRLIAVDLHSDAAEAALAVPVEHLRAGPLLSSALRPHIKRDSVIVAPDLGGAKRARAFAESLDLPLAVVQKTRTTGGVTVHGVVGNVRGLHPIIVDDMISTAGTIEAAARLLRTEGAAPELFVAATHALLVGPAVERLASSGIARLFCTDSVPQLDALPFAREVVPIAPLIGDALRAM
jgi:ribose-phosphate pyrophosphokinase